MHGAERERHPRIAGCFLLALALSSGDASGQPNFCFPWRTQIPGGGAASIAIVDLDADRNEDLVLAGSAGVSVLLSDGAGGFSTPVQYPALGAVSVAAADFNEDGNADVAVARQAGPSSGDLVSVFLGTGRGDLRPPKTSPGISMAIATTVSDFNRDGHSDLAIASYSRAIRVLLGDGTGELTPGHYAQFLPQSVFSIATGDFDNDSNPDLVTQADFAGIVLVFFGDGTGRFDPPREVFTGMPLVYSLGVADFDEDGNADIAATAAVGASVVILRGKGTGDFHPAVKFGGTAGARWLALDDLNGDTHIDVAVAAESGRKILLFPGDGRGALSAPDELVLHSAYGPSHVALGDFNGDGRPDIAASGFGFASVGINGGMSISPAPRSLRVGAVGQIYAPIEFSASGALAPESFRLEGELPRGMTFTPDPPTLAGVPIHAGRFPFTLTATAANGCAVSQSYLLVIQRAATTITLASSPNPAVPGASVRITATVASSPGTSRSPTGKVTFTDGDGGFLGKAELVNGRAETVVSALDAGKTFVHASYEGDADFLPVASTPLSQVVRADADYPSRRMLPPS